MGPKYNRKSNQIDFDLMPVEILPFFFFSGSTVVIILQREGFFNSLLFLLCKVNRDHYNYQIHCLMYKHGGHKIAGGFPFTIISFRAGFL